MCGAALSLRHFHTVGFWPDDFRVGPLPLIGYSRDKGGKDANDIVLQAWRELSRGDRDLLKEISEPGRV